MGRKYSGNRRANIHLQHIRHRRATETQIRCFNFKIRVEIAAHYVNFAHCGVCSIYYSHMSACRYDFSIKIRQTHIINARMFYNTHTHIIRAYRFRWLIFLAVIFLFLSLRHTVLTFPPTFNAIYIFFFCCETRVILVCSIRVRLRSNTRVRDFFRIYVHIFSLYAVQINI